MLIAGLVEQLTGDKFLDWIHTTGEQAKTINFKKLVLYLDESLNIKEDESWTRIGIINRDQSSILALLVHLTHAAGANLKLPSNVSAAVMKPTMIDGVLKNKTTIHKITSSDETQFDIQLGTPSVVSRESRFNHVADIFDGLVDTPEKLDQIGILITVFVNEILEPIKLQISNLTSDFEDGKRLLVLIGCLGNFYIPCKLDYEEHTASKKLEIIKLCFYYMSLMGIDCSNFVASDFLRGDAKGILRCLYALFEYEVSTNR